MANYPGLDNTFDLSRVNAAAIGATFPVISQPSDHKVQTGTMETLMHNIRWYDKMHAELIDRQRDNQAKPEDMSEAQAQLQRIENDMREAVPLLAKAGLFDLFETDEWIQGRGLNSAKRQSQGRRLVGIMAREAGH